MNYAIYCVRRTLLTAAATAGVLLALAPAAGAQTYPSRTVTFVVPSNAGASSDRFARMIGKELAKQTGAANVVENKAGANGIIGVQSVLNGVLPSIKANQIRVSATTATKRLANHPDLPTFVENQVDFTLATWNGMFVKPGTPPEAAETLARITREALETPEAQSYREANAYDDFLITGDAAAARVNQDLVTWKALTEAAGVVAQ